MYICYLCENITGVRPDLSHLQRKESLDNHNMVGTQLAIGLNDAFGCLSQGLLLEKLKFYGENDQAL